jgi:hypothetical protein
MTLPPAARAELRQFRLLARTSVRRLLGSAVLSREADPILFAIWGVALGAIPPAGFALRTGFAYDRMMGQPLEDILPTVLMHRAFLVLYAMLAAALLGALMWETLLPDRDDHEIIGVLPVRPRTLAASRLAAAVAVAVTVALAVSVPSGVLFTLVSLPRADLGMAPLLFLGHVAGAVLGALLVFLALLAVRVLLAAGVGARASERLAVVLQVGAVAGLIEVFVFLPGVLPAVVRPLTESVGGAGQLPTTWFVPLHTWIAAGDIPVPMAGVGAALGSVAGTAALTVAAYLGLASRIERRSLEARHDARAGRVFPTLARAAARATRASAPVRGLLLFAVASLTRSRRHLLVVATYLGFAAAAGSISLIRATRGGGLDFATPSLELLSLAAILLYVMTLGLRAAFAVPTDLDANWPLRLYRVSVPGARLATRLAMHFFVTAPVALLVFLVGLVAGWRLSFEAQEQGVHHQQQHLLPFGEWCLRDWLGVAWEPPL